MFPEIEVITIIRTPEGFYVYSDLTDEEQIQLLLKAVSVVENSDDNEDDNYYE